MSGVADLLTVPEVAARLTEAMGILQSVITARRAGEFWRSTPTALLLDAAELIRVAQIKMARGE